MQRKMFGRQALLDALQQIGNNLEKDIAIYLIGGCAMTFMGQKVSTKDIDVVFSSLKDLELFIEAAKKSGFFALRSCRGIQDARYMDRGKKSRRHAVRSL